MRIVKMSDLIETPWKNGRGVTREIASERVDDALLWRLSMADVSVDGPFSSFAGLTRVLTVTRGRGLILHGPDGDLLAQYAQPARFDGGTSITAELIDGPVRDFNLMFDTARCEGHAEVLCGPAHIRYDDADQMLVVHSIAGTVRLGETATLGAGDTAIEADIPVRLELYTGDVALCICMRKRDQTDTSKSTTAVR